ncbi:MAG: hypothetical protein AMXMBFR84_00900 [Candidatus Hydrogenedentota bacterium]
MSMRILSATLAVAAACLASWAQDPLTLAKKASIFEHDLRVRFMKDGQVLCKLKLPSGSRTFNAYNMPDNAYMTGIHTGTLSLKYASTKDPEALAEAKQCLRALELLCTVSGEPGLLARAAWPADEPMEDDGGWNLSRDGKYKWRDDVSSDQMTGVFYGFALAYLHLDDEAKEIAVRNVKPLSDHLLRNNLRIIDHDGKPTQWGSYYPEYVMGRESMNALLLLQHLKVTAALTGEPASEAVYKTWAIEKEYAGEAVKARRLADPLGRRGINHSDDVLIFLAYYPLLVLEEDPTLRETYLASFKRAWTGDDRFPGVKPENNPFYAFMANTFIQDASTTAASIETLQLFPFDIKWNSSTIREYEKAFEFSFDPAPKSAALAGPGVVPIDLREKTWSTWVQDPYKSAGDRTQDQPMEFNGHDYLMAYWLGRYAGYIAPEQ